MAVNNNSFLTTKRYPMNDLGSVYTHYNPKTGRNEPTKNEIIIKKEVNKDGKSS